MSITNLTSRWKMSNRAVIAFFLFLIPLTGVYAACCAGHGGVASCNKSTGYKMCKDGTASPTCMCKAPKKTTKKATPKSKNTGVTPPTTTTTTAPTPAKAKHWWNGKSTNTTPSNSTSSSSSSKNSAAGSSTSAKGCCSNHKGVAQCNRATGHQMCNDGTQSPSCTCH